MQFLGERLCCLSSHEARAEEVRAAHGQGVLLLAPCPAYATRITCKLFAVTAKPVCICLQKTTNVCVPAIGLGREDACWEVQKWLKTLLFLLDVEIWFWFRSLLHSFQIFILWLR